MKYLIFLSMFIVDLSPDPPLTVMGHYPLAKSLAELVESRVAMSQRSSQERAQAFEQPTALIPCWACVSWHPVPVLISWHRKR